MKYTILLLAIAATMLVACNNGSGPKTSTSNQPVNFTLPAKTSTLQQPGQFATNTPTTTLPGATTQPAPTPTQTVAAVNTSKAGLNPEHGKPGHRCDIAVGAPLNSKPATTAATTSTTTNNAAVDMKTQTFSSPTTTNASTTKAGLNPPHGQPGHRCDIAVGAPLDSKPITSSTTSTTTPVTTSSIPAYNPIQPAGTTTATIPVKTDAVVTTPGMNPEHGKPGHRCDIAVGAPLDSKATIVTEKEKTIPTEKKN